MATPTIQNFGNNLVVKKADYRFAGNFTDENRLTNLFGYDNLKGENYLGIFSVFNQWSVVNTPLLKRSIMEKNIIYTNGNVDFLSFDMPYRLEGVTVKSDLTEDIAQPGVDGSWFEIHLGDGGLDSVFQVGDRITADYYDGQNLIVVEVGVRFGLGFKYKVKLITDDKTEYFNKSQLAVSTQFFKVGHSVNEYSEYGSGLSQGFGLMKLQHRLGGRRMLEYTITGDAQRLELAGVAKVGGFEFDLSALNKYGNLSDAMNGGYMVMGDNAGGGKIKKGTMSWIPFIEVMLHNELARLEELDITFAQGGTVTLTGAAGRNITVPVGQGLYQQMKKGNWRDFPRYSREAVIDTFNQAFRNRPDIPDYQRKFKLEGGRGAVQEFQRIFQQELNTTANQLGGTIDMSQRGIGAISGDAMNLKVGYRVQEVFISGTGWVTIEHNPAFDATQSRVMDEPMIGGLPKRSYTSCIFDLTDQESTNAAKMSPDVEFAKGMDTGANIYLVKNKKFPGTKISYVNGRTSPYPVSAGSGQVISSRFDGYTQLLENQSNIFLKDPTRSILLEIK